MAYKVIILLMLIQKIIRGFPQNFKYLQSHVQISTFNLWKGPISSWFPLKGFLADEFN